MYASAARRTEEWEDGDEFPLGSGRGGGMGTDVELQGGIVRKVDVDITYHRDQRALAGMGGDQRIMDAREGV